MNSNDIEEIKYRINLYSNLKINWDGYNADPPNKISQNLALEVLKISEKYNCLPVDCLPFADGGLTFIYISDICISDTYVDIEFHNDGDMCICFVDINKNIKAFNITMDDIHYYIKKIIEFIKLPKSKICNKITSKRGFLYE